MKNGEDKFSESMDQFTRMWAEFASQVAAAGLAFSPDAPPPKAARQMRSAVFQAMAQYAEEFMRSPQFLESMQQGLAAATALRKQFKQSLGSLQHEWQGATREDVDALVARLRRMETRFMERLEAMEKQMTALAQRVEGMGAVGRQGGRTPDADEAAQVAEKPRVQTQRPARRKGRGGS